MIIDYAIVSTNDNPTLYGSFKDIPCRYTNLCSK